MSENSVADLESEKETLVKAYLVAKGSGDTKAAASALLRLDGFYWRYVQALIEARIEPGMESLDFSTDQRLVLDMGLLDERLVTGAKPTFREELIAELEQSSTDNHFYLSEWLEDRFRRFRTNQAVTMGEVSDMLESRHEDERQKVLHHITPLVRKLPGVPAEVAEAVASGKLDLQLLQMSSDIVNNRIRSELMLRHRLWDLRRQVISKARSRLGDSPDLRYFDQLDSLYKTEWREMYREVRQNPDMTAQERQDKIRQRRQAEQLQHFKKTIADFLLAELNFAKSLMPLGALAGGIVGSCAVLTSSEKRITKKDAALMIGRAHECVGSFDTTPVVLIAPFKGRGIYEWDRDSLVIGLHPCSTPDDSLANAIANYTMMIDSLQKGGSLKKSYSSAFPQTSFQKDFQQDFRSWLCEAGVGEFECMDPQRLQFFRHTIGLNLKENPAQSLAPAQMRHLTDDARRIIRTQLQKQVKTARDSWGARWRLGLLLWMEGDKENALREITVAAKLMPTEVPLLMGVSLLLIENGRLAQAQKILRICRDKGESSIWQLYAEEQLQKLQDKSGVN